MSALDRGLVEMMDRVFATPADAYPALPRELEEFLRERREAFATEECLNNNHELGPFYDDWDCCERAKRRAFDDTLRKLLDGDDAFVAMFTKRAMELDDQDREET